MPNLFGGRRGRRALEQDEAELDAEADGVRPSSWRANNAGGTRQTEELSSPPRTHRPVCTILIVLVSMAMTCVELVLNARGHEMDGPPSPDCHYRASLRTLHLCAASLDVNPLFGPSGDTLGRLGAVSGDRIVNYGEPWRLATGLFLQVGAIQLLVNSIALLAFGAVLERHHGFLRVCIVYLGSGLMGNVAAAAFQPEALVVGSSAAVLGVIGAAASNLALNWRSFRFPCLSGLVLPLGIAALLALGTVPLMDLLAHFFALLAGILLGTSTLRRMQKGRTDCNMCLRRGARFASFGFFGTFLIGGFALLYGVGQFDAAAICPGCTRLACQPFPAGCGEGGQLHENCWWSCDAAYPAQVPCAGDAVWLQDGTDVGYVELQCPAYFAPAGGLHNITLYNVSLTDWGAASVEALCDSEC